MAAPQELARLPMAYRHCGVEVRVDWVPGRAGGIGNGAAQALVSEHMGARSVLVTQNMTAPEDPHPTATIWARTPTDKNTHNPWQGHPLPRGLARGAEALIHKACARLS